MPIEGEYLPGTWDLARDQVERIESSGGTKGLTMSGAPCVVLWTRGRKSGAVRKAPLIRVEHEGTYAAVASLGGAPKHPVWYLNLTADPEVTVQDGTEVRDYLAREVSGDEKAQWWARATEVWPSYDQYQAKTDRDHPGGAAGAQEVSGRSQVRVVASRAWTSGLPGCWWSTTRRPSSTCCATRLRFAGYEVHVARRGFEALRAAADVDPDLLILDVNLPDIDGFEICRRLRADGSQVPVVFLTARDDRDDLRTGFTRGGDDYLTKPFSLEELDLRIQAILRRTRHGAAAATTPASASGAPTSSSTSPPTGSGGPAPRSSCRPPSSASSATCSPTRAGCSRRPRSSTTSGSTTSTATASIVETYISYLRKKVDHVEPRLIRTIRGVGYTIRDDDCMTIRARLTLAVALLLAVATGVLGWVVVGEARRAMVDRLDERLVDAAERPLRDFARPGPGQPDASDERSVAEVVVLADGNVVLSLPAGFGDSPEPLPVLPDPATEDVDALVGTIVTMPSEGGGADQRVLTTVAGRGNLELGYRFLAASLAPVDATTDRLWAVFGLTLLVVGAAGAAIAWWVVRSGLRPVDRMIDTAGAIAGGDLTARVDHPDDATELGRLGTALDEMLGRLEVAFAEQEASEQRVKRFAADASHELRTPITAIRGYAELYQRGGLADEEALARAMARIEGESTRMGRLVEELLLLARLDQRRPLERSAGRPPSHRGSTPPPTTWRVSPEHPLVVRDARRGRRGAVVAGDEAALRQVVANLLANVRVHTPPGTTTHRRAPLGAASSILPWPSSSCPTTGPGIPPDQIDRAFERFHRGDPSRSRDTGGAGLGLAIVDGARRRPRWVRRGGRRRTGCPVHRPAPPRLKGVGRGGGRPGDSAFGVGVVDGAGTAAPTREATGPAARRARAARRSPGPRPAPAGPRRARRPAPR